jgi:hypothetical protein
VRCAANILSYTTVYEAACKKWNRRAHMNESGNLLESACKDHLRLAMYNVNMASKTVS